MNMDDLMEQLDELLEDGFKMPGKRVVLDIEKVRAIIDDMRMTMPTEIKQAKGIVADRADIINNAKREAEQRRKRRISRRPRPAKVLYPHAKKKTKAEKTIKVKK